MKFKKGKYYVYKDEVFLIVAIHSSYNRTFKYRSIFNDIIHTCYPGSPRHNNATLADMYNTKLYQAMHG